MFANYKQARIMVVCLAVFLLGLLGLLVCPGSALAKDDAVEGEYIIKYKAGVDAQTKSKVLNKHALENRKNFKIINAQLVKLPAGRMQAQSTSSLLEELAADPAVEYIEPNYYLYPLGTPISGDNYAANQWGLKNYGQIINGYSGVPGIDINLERAWLITHGSPNVLVAVIDTGVDISHPDLAGAIWTNEIERYGMAGVDDDGNGFVDDVHGWDFLNGDNSVFDSGSVDYHGTHCAGIIAAARDATGVVGTAPGVKILPLKFMDASSGTTVAAISAIEYAKAVGAKIVNCSWGGPGEQSLYDAIANSGMLFVAAAGNAGQNIDTTPLYPASFDLTNIITVAAIDNQGSLASFSSSSSSNYGPQSVDVAAPGKYIYSTLPDNKYGYLNGTSMATPHVSGIAALVVSAGYTDNTVIKQRILDSAALHPLASLQGKVLTGGLVDATAAAEIEMAPLASDLSIIGELFQGKTLQAAYTFFDLNGDLESGTVMQWYRADAEDKSNGTAIDGATGAQYTLTVDDIGKFIYFSVTPAATSGTTPGTVTESSAVGPVETAHLTSLQILNGTENLLTSFSGEQTNYTLFVDPTLTSLQVLYTEVGGCTVTVSFNGETLTGDQITLDGQGGTVTVVVQALGIADRAYTITIRQADNCFIATAAFGSKFTPAVKLLRKFRDEYLLTNEFGKAFVAFYYRHSPPLAHYIANRDDLRALVRMLLAPFIALVYLLYHKWLLAALILMVLAARSRKISNRAGW